MARRGWSATNYLNLTTGVVTAAPLTISAWARTSISAQFQLIAGVFNSTAGSNRQNFALYARASVPVDGLTFQSGSAAGSAQCVTSTSFSVNTWFHACGVTASNASRAVYLNGGGKGTDVVSDPNPTITRTSIGIADNTTHDSPFAPGGTGDIADVAFWNAALTDTEVLALASGVSPLMIRPQNLVAYFPLIGNNSPENNLLSNANTMTINGTLSASPHPRLFLPSSRSGFRHHGDVRYLLGRTNPRIFRPMAGPSRGLIGLNSYPADPNILLLTQGRVTPVLFRPMAGPSRGLKPTINYLPTVASAVSYNQTITVTSSGTVTFQKATTTTVAATGLGTVSVAKATTKTIAAACAGAVSYLKATTKTIGAACAGAVAYLKATTKTIAATGTGAVVISRAGVFGRTIAVTATGAVAVTKATTKTIGAACGGAVTYIKATGKTVSAACAGAVTTSKQSVFGRTISVAATGTVTVLKATTKTISAAATSLVGAISAIWAPPSVGSGSEDSWWRIVLRRRR